MSSKLRKTWSNIFNKVTSLDLKLAIETHQENEVLPVKYTSPITKEKVGIPICTLS